MARYLSFSLFLCAFNMGADLCTIMPNERRIIADRLMNLEDIHYKDSSIFLPHTIAELNVVAGTKDTPDMHLRNKIDASFTVFGSAMLDFLLTNPNIKLDQTRKRQDALKELFYNPELLSSCRKPLEIIGQSENALLMGWANENPFKESPDILTATGSLFGASQSPHYLESIRTGLTITDVGVKTLLGFAAIDIVVEVGYLLLKDSISLKRSQDKLKALVILGILSANVAWWYKVSPAFHHQEKISLEMQTMMMDISKMVTATKQLYTVVKNFPAIIKATKYFDVIEKFATKSPSLSSDLRWLLEELESLTFQGDASSWSHMGRVRACYTTFMGVKQEFAPLCKAIGEIDAFTGVATIMVAHKEKSGPQYCFTEFIVDSDMPRFEIDAVWNPVLQTNERDAEKLITESFALGGGKESVANMLLTGPHGSGKSSLLREAAYAVYLSEMLGIAPAKSCRMTFFSTINTYLAVQDNMEKGLSAFMAAQNRLDAIQKRILELKEDRFGISFIDEPVKDTFEDNASKLITHFGIAVGPVTEHVCMLATHYIEPALVLEDQATGRFTNYHMKIEEITYGRFKRRYKLLPGKAVWWFNDNEQRERYIKWLKTIV